MARFLPERPVRCNHCDEMLSIDKFGEHLSVCIHRPVPCPHECGHQIPRRGLNVHISSCGYATIKCPDCKHQCRRNQLDQHGTSCGGAWIQCPRCESKLKRKNMSKHAKACKLMQEKKRLDQKTTFFKIRTYGRTKEILSNFEWNIKPSEDTMRDLTRCVAGAMSHTESDEYNRWQVFHSKKFALLLEEVSHMSNVDRAASKYMETLQHKRKRSHGEALNTLNKDISKLSKYRKDMKEWIWGAVRVFIIRWRNRKEGNITHIYDLCVLIVMQFCIIIHVYYM